MHSNIKNPPVVSPFNVNDHQLLGTGVHDGKDCPMVVFNRNWLPGVSEGDLLRVSPKRTSEDEPRSSGFLFVVPKSECCPKPSLQLSIPHTIAEIFGIKNNGEALVTKVEHSEACVDFVELMFQDLYMGRTTMLKLTETLVGQCIYTGQVVSFVGAVAAKICAISVRGQNVESGYVTTATKTIFRTLSAKVTIFIQVCRELWDFAGDGERSYEKIVHSFLPALCAKWREAGANHVVSIILISRVYYDQSEIEYAAGPLLRDGDGRWYKDFFKVIVDLEVIHEWNGSFSSLKNSLWDFQRDILLDHHYHQNTVNSTSPSPEPVRLVGRISYAHDGPILEALNLGLTPTETHFVDRSLSITGASTILITSGTGYFRVSKALLRLTTTRILDQGFGLDLISVAKAPLHQSPIFSFQSSEPELGMDRDGKTTARDIDPLWGGPDETEDNVHEKTTFWWDPFWISVSFWDHQIDLPLRQDRFLARAKMHEIEMLGLLDQDVLSSIDVPLLPTHSSPLSLAYGGAGPSPVTQREADQFDNDIFALNSEADTSSRKQSGSGTLIASSYRLTADRRSVTSFGTHTASSRTQKPLSIQGRSQPIIMDLPNEEPTYSALTTMRGSTSPSQTSILSMQSNCTTSKAVLNSRRTTRDNGAPRSFASRFAPTWILNSFRGVPSIPQTSPVAATSCCTPSSTPNATPRVTPSRLPTAVVSAAVPLRSGSSPELNTECSNHTSSLNNTWQPSPDEGKRLSSPLATPPHDGYSRSNRRSATWDSLMFAPTSGSKTNPSRPAGSSAFTLSGHWRHLFPMPDFKYSIKWKSIIAPACFPLTVEQFPTASELESSYNVTSYDFVIHPPEMRSFLVLPPNVKGDKDEIRDAWALTVMRGMVAVRLAQNFQLVVRPQKLAHHRQDHTDTHRSKSFMLDDDKVSKPAGVADILKSTDEAIYLCMPNEIHRISYNGEAVQVKRYSRRMPKPRPIKYQCLLWPKFGAGYTELQTSFNLPGLLTYGWNRLDMLVAGYEQQFSESLRYWRTRFVVIPTAERPQDNFGSCGEALSDEEIRIHGIDKLAELFTRLRWDSPHEDPLPPVRFLHTTLSPAASVLDDTLLTQLDELHFVGRLHKKIKSEREIGVMSLASIAKAMREEDGVSIKLHMWHKREYPDSFLGYDFVNWLVREFRDVSSRSQATELGARFLEQGLFDHCRGAHGFMDGHYFYHLKGEYAVPATPRSWFRSRPALEEVNGRNLSSVGKNPSPRRNKSRLILSQSMVLDLDPNKRSDLAETVILHHDIIHNPSHVFHFELQWLGTTARIIEEQIRLWSGRLERYGLKLVEAYVTQICDIQERNNFQSCFPIPLRVVPPLVPSLVEKSDYGILNKYYFEYAILRKFGFVLDTEALDLYPPQVDVHYSYRRSPCTHTQFVHSSGTAFVQVLGGKRGFLVLSNRLMSSGRMASSSRSRNQQSPTEIAREITTALSRFCQNGDALKAFYREELEVLEATSVEEPPPLSI